MTARDQNNALYSELRARVHNTPSHYVYMAIQNNRRRRLRSWTLYISSVGDRRRLLRPRSLRNVESFTIVRLPRTTEKAIRRAMAP
mgnify:CR=1 FL=1